MDKEEGVRKTTLIIMYNSLNNKLNNKSCLNSSLSLYKENEVGDKEEAIEQV